MHNRSIQHDGYRVCLFEDAAVAALEPIALTRPVFDLLCGASSLATRQLRMFGPAAAGAFVRPYLADVCRLQYSELTVNDLSWLRSGPAILVNARWLPPVGPVHDLAGPCVALVGEEVAYAVVEPEQLAGWGRQSVEDCLQEWKASLPTCDAGGRFVNYLWDLVEANREQLASDFERHRRSWPTQPSSHLAVVGPVEGLLVHAAARIDPMVVADTTNGPVMIDAGAFVAAFTRLEGPCYVGPHTHVLGARLRAGTTLGPHCRVGGEVEASIVHGYSNKYHDGFLGHAYVGEWVNLGAGTSNSDLRNDYGEVTVTVAGRRVATGLTKVGCFLGDHTKTGLGTLLNTGTNAGAFCNLLPSGGLLPRYVPSFCRWGDGTLADNADLPRLLATAQTVMARRGAHLTEAHAALYRGLFERTAAERRRALALAEQRRLRRSA